MTVVNDNYRHLSKGTAMITLPYSSIIRSKVDDKYNCRVIVTRTVIRTIGAAGKGIHSAQDIVTAINNQLKQDEHLTEKQVEQVLSKVAKDIADGYRYNDLSGRLVKLGMGWFEYR